MAATDQSIQNALNVPSTDWRATCNALIEHLVEEGECFSSGELARWMRIYRPDLKFSVPNLGGYVRDLYYACTLPQYADDGEGNGPCNPTQVPRTTEGLGRTPAGVEVFVYAPNGDAGYAHNFEVDIPQPGGPATQYSTNATPGTPKTPAAAGDGVVIAGSAKPLMALKATVQQDRRLQVPRAAFEAFVHFCGATMRGGDPVYVKVEMDKATITLADPGDGAKEYNLWADSGRVSFPSPSTPFNPGDTFLVNIAPNGLTVDLTVKV